MNTPKFYDLEVLCPDCQGLTPEFNMGNLVSALMERLMAGESLDTKQLNLLAGVTTYRQCSCSILITGVLNWPNLNQLKELLIPD